MNRINFKILINKSGHQIINIDEFSLGINKINFLFGESGIGKTLISKVIFGLLNPQQFQISINNQDYNKYTNNKETIAYRKDGFFVFQEPSTHLNPLLKIGTQLKEGSLNTGKNEREILKQLWANPNNDQFLSLLKVFPKPYRPSGGEKQRFLLAMALKKIDQYIEGNQESTPLFVFDEPSGSLDDRLRNIFLELVLDKFRQKKFTILFITHDYSIISEATNNHHDLRNTLVFNELVKQKKSVILTSFDEYKYLSWINKNKNFAIISNDSTNKLLFSLKSKIKVFNKTINIYKDSKCQNPTDLNICKNEIVYLKAPSGTGKTTIAKIIMGLISANKFEMNINGRTFNNYSQIKEWKKRLWGKQISMTFQHADESLNLKSTVQQTLMNLPRKKRPPSNELIKKLKMIFDSELDASFLKKRIWQLSGGQKQRLNLLRTLLLETPLLILDEPLNGLDFNSIMQVIELVIQRKEQGTGILIISHNEEIIETIVEDNSIFYLSQN